MSEEDQTCWPPALASWVKTKMKEGQVVCKSIKGFGSHVDWNGRHFQSLISDEEVLTSLSPVSLGILSDILVTSAPERVEEVTAYFIESYEDSELLGRHIVPKRNCYIKKSCR